MFDLILALIVVLALFISSIIDIKTREVPDELSISLIVVAVILKFFQAYFSEWSVLLISLIGFGIFLGISLIMYYTRQWGGGDAKLFMAIGIALPYFPEKLNFLNANLNINFLLIILINVLIFGFVYGMSYILYLYYKKKLRIKFKLNKYFLFLSVIFIILSLFFQYELRILLLVLALVVFIYPYLITLTKAVENKVLTYKLKVSKLTEGDWIIKDVKHKGKLISSIHDID